jgi:hypothetical protein
MSELGGTLAGVSFCFLHIHAQAAANPLRLSRSIAIGIAWLNGMVGLCMQYSEIIILLLGGGGHARGVFVHDPAHDIDGPALELGASNVLLHVAAGLGWYLHVRRCNVGYARGLRSRHRPLLHPRVVVAAESASKGYIAKVLRFGVMY